MAGLDVDQPIDLDDARDIAQIMVDSRRMPPSTKWVDRQRDDEADTSVEGLF